MPLSVITPYLEELPSPLSAQIERCWERIGEAIDVIQLNEQLIESVTQAFARSDFIMDSLSRYPQWLEDDTGNPVFGEQSPQHMRDRLAEKLLSATDEASLMKALREFRCRQMVRIIGRDLLQRASLDETLVSMSALADCCVDLALQKLYGWAVQKHGVPRDRQGEQQYLIVLGMGKLGARELNVSSDIDLIFAFPRAGETDHASKPIDNQQFFNRLGQRLINVLDQQTAEGFVFRVDMRLRPYGGSGSLTLNFAAFEDYYQNQGREWERFAMIKSRVIAGDARKGEELLEIVRPFVYRRYADFSSFQALRDMKRMIMSEVHRKGGDQNIKLGEGGIREIEFIVQACQLIYGGRDMRLQTPVLIPLFRVIAEEGYLPESWLQQLEQANAFLRRLEHAIQGLKDQQTQLIPADEFSRERVAMSMGFDAWGACLSELDKHRAAVSRIFAEFLREEENDDPEEQAEESAWLHLWQAQGDEDAWVKALNQAGFESPAETFALVDELRHSRQYGVMSSEAKSRFEQFLPPLLCAVSDCERPSVTFERVMGFVRGVLGRTVYLVLLYENPGALSLLCQLCSESPWISEHLSKSPVILDELLDAQNLYRPPAKDELQDELRQHLLRIPREDLEAQMDALRHFKQSHMLRVAAAELGGKLPLMKVSDYLTWLAEALVEASVELAWTNMTEKYGVPSGLHAEAGDKGFIAVGYGKLGGIELGYSSDLDMVFIYRGDDHGATNGERSINNQMFYTRLGQRIIHILSTQTTQGDLYEVDMRLRPSGNSGMLVSSLAAFEKYQRQDAWTWEHQALVRARAICGDAALINEFYCLREAILAQPRDLAKLREEVLGMRDKMRRAAVDKFKGEEAARQHMKQGEGGLIDIEFITQYGVLAYASEYPELLQWSDNIRQLESLIELKCFKDIDLAPLMDAYRTLRSAMHRKTLAGKEYHVSLADFEAVRTDVVRIWRAVFALE
ncbi:MAG: bifunctional [glutamate--ammonia ligase]-adenylyl-L-tyrosine phosphorylase/[glutamate--ammonia-ligase] adenylyltransferase [Oleiphilaceae bacterium]|nr:bifunctional [glutamate--ammonia ligase]-adenylyl-L-tyrosine phosphorylase/[glutamate--ammonia-ligase] adenylyltransferase [Oleiphilaceae bacterium]